MRVVGDKHIADFFVFLKKRLMQANRYDLAVRKTGRRPTLFQLLIAGFCESLGGSIHPDAPSGDGFLSKSLRDIVVGQFMHIVLLRKGYM
jgi:hypothetical protein